MGGVRLHLESGIKGGEPGIRAETRTGVKITGWIFFLGEKCCFGVFALKRNEKM
jgi:hypothetical protein